MDEAIKPLDLQEKPIAPIMDKTKKKIIKTPLVVFFFMLIILGIGSGFMLSKFGTNKTPGGSALLSNTAGSNGKVEVGKTYGSTTQNFKDTATGVVEKNG